DPPQQLLLLRDDDKSSSSLLFLTVTHSLKYFYTASSGIPNFPSYVSVGLVDGVQISYCDSRTQKNIPKQEWMNEVSSEHPRYWEEETKTCWEKQQMFNVNIDIAKQRFNQTGGVHVFQLMYGCEWDEETKEKKGYWQYSYDGEDFIAFDLSTKKWNAPVPQAVLTKNKWDNDKGWIAQAENYLNQICPEWVKKYVEYGKTSLMRTGIIRFFFFVINFTGNIITLALIITAVIVLVSFVCVVGYIFRKTIRQKLSCGRFTIIFLNFKSMLLYTIY
uniref:MHC class I-like antigen recognition-like domain-containing protein n=1 Tax=Cyprinodon variegatus TaxID=28743 RepID=A0A3Q2D2B2_CYPVA